MFLNRDRKIYTQMESAVRERHRLRFNLSVPHSTECEGVQRLDKLPADHLYTAAANQLQLTQTALTPLKTAHAVTMLTKLRWEEMFLLLSLSS